MSNVKTEIFTKQKKKIRIEKSTLSKLQIYLSDTSIEIFTKQK